MALSNTVRERREARGWTQQQLADRLGISRQAISQIERGDFEPSARVLLRLANALEADCAELFRAEPA